MEIKENYSANVWKMLLIIFLFFFSQYIMADTRQCPKCDGSGWQLTIPDLSHFGVEKTKRKCPVCGKMVFSGHMDKCTMCGGTGHIESGHNSSSGSVADRKAAEGELFFDRYLTSAENSLRMTLMQSLFATKYVVETCSICHGSKLCNQCGGVQNFSIDVDFATLCRVCGGTGMCIACNGQGCKNGHIEDANSPAEKEKITRNIKVLSVLANLRYFQNKTPGDPNGPSLGIDSNGNYYIKK